MVLDEDEYQPQSFWGRNAAPRSMSVAEYMQADLGVSGSQLRVSGHGEFAPKEGNDTAEGRAANRRIEFVFVE